GPHRHLRRAHHPADHFREDLRVLAHRRAHAPLGQAVGAGEVALERVHAGRLAALDDLDPGVLAVLLHDRGDQNAVGVSVFELLDLVDPGGEGAVADQLDVLPADDFLRFGGAQPPVARLHVDDLGGVEADGFTYDRAPAFVERLADDVGVGPRRPRGDD